MDVNKPLLSGGIDGSDRWGELGGYHFQLLFPLGKISWGDGAVFLFGKKAP